MEKIYANSYDHDVKTVVLYATSGSPAVLYCDKEFTIAATRDAVFDLFIKRMLIIARDDESYFVPTDWAIGPMGPIIKSGDFSFHFASETEGE